MAVNTPLHTIETLRGIKARADDNPRTGASFVDGLDTRVLKWLCDDAERLNKLESRAIEAGFHSIEDMLQAATQAMETRAAM
jgi:hypothetical protein